MGYSSLTDSSDKSYLWKANYLLYRHDGQPITRNGLPSSVINLSEEIGIIILGSITILSQPKTQDGEVTKEQNSEDTDIVNTEPFVGTLSGQGGWWGENCRDGSSGNGWDGLEGIGLGIQCGLDNGACFNKIGTQDINQWWSMTT